MEQLEQFDKARSSRSFFGTLCQIAGVIGIGGSFIYGFAASSYDFAAYVIPAASGIAASSLLGSVGTITNQAKKQSSLLEFKIGNTLK